MVGKTPSRLCAQCRNHGLRVPVKGHKRYCAYKLCTCKECCLVKERQRVVALHLYVRRAQDQEEADSSQMTSRDRSREDVSGVARERMLYESLLVMRQAFPVGEEAMALLLCILKHSRSVQEASWKIYQGTYDLTSRGFVGLDNFLRSGYG
nr:doublesex-like protein [Thermobia domestica]